MKNKIKSQAKKLIDRLEETVSVVKNIKNRPQKKNNNEVTIKPVSKNTLRIIPIGGVEEVGKNCTVLEYGNDIIIVDYGIQFPPDDMHGIQYMIPDFSYLQQNRKKIRGIFITHGHLDHIGGLPYFAKEVSDSIPVYGSNLSIKLIEKKSKETGANHPLRTVKPGDKIKMGSFFIKFFHVNHTIPGCLGMAIENPVGTVVTMGDWKIDYTPIGDSPADLREIASIGSQGVLALLGDSTNAYKSGFQTSESEVMKNLDQVYSSSPGRIIVGTFASSLSRIQQIITLAEKYNRKVFFAGYSMRTNVGIAKDLKYFKFNPKTLIGIKELKSLPDDKIIIACTGVQGEENAALGRIAADKHPDIRIQKGDHIVFSSSVIPGNEQPIQTLLDKIYRKGGKVINIEAMAVHSGGHAKSEEVKLVYHLLKPKYYIPVHGSHYLLCKHKELIESLNHPKEQIIVPDNGSLIEFNKQKKYIVNNKKLDIKTIAIDGLVIGDINDSIIKDRQSMAENGVFVIGFTINSKTLKLATPVKIATRGFIILKNSEGLINEAKTYAESFWQDNVDLYKKNSGEFYNLLKKNMQQLLFKKTEREPMVLPLVNKI